MDAHLGYWLRGVSNQIWQALSRKLEDKGITLAEWVLLRELYDGERRPSALAEKLGLTRGTISKLARRLEAKRMVAQETWGHTGDLRAQLLALTDIGRSTVPVLASLADETDKEFFGHLDPRTREVILSAMREILRRRGSPPAAPT